MPESSFEEIKKSLEEIQQGQKKQSQKLDKISNWAMGTELQNGAESRIRRNERFIKNIKTRLYAIVGGFVAVIIFIIRWLSVKGLI